MSRKIRLIARLDVKDDFLVKGIQYETGVSYVFLPSLYPMSVEGLSLALSLLMPVGVLLNVPVMVTGSPFIRRALSTVTVTGLLL